jgi:hypothetical protein
LGYKLVPKFNRNFGDIIDIYSQDMVRYSVSVSDTTQLTISNISLDDGSVMVFAPLTISNTW